MTADHRSAFDLAAWIFVHAFFGASLIQPLKESGAAEWHLGYALLAGAACLVGAVLLAFGLRNCARLWQMRRGTASNRSLMAVGLFGVLCGLLSDGPITSGVWKWESLLFAALASYFLVILGLEMRAKTLRAQPR